MVPYNFGVQYETSLDLVEYIVYIGYCDGMKLAILILGALLFGGSLKATLITSLHGTGYTFSGIDCSSDDPNACAALTDYISYDYNLPAINMTTLVITDGGYVSPDATTLTVFMSITPDYDWTEDDVFFFRTLYRGLLGDNGTPTIFVCAPINIGTTDAFTFAETYSLTPTDPVAGGGDLLIDVPTPEPATTALFGLALVSLPFLRRRR